jgi:hypothetical protein
MWACLGHVLKYFYDNELCSVYDLVINMIMSSNMMVKKFMESHAHPSIWSFDQKRQPWNKHYN